eukprot:GHVT01069444.1.p1 GENE.GHVT01069444.1~~GHVT01069444.1.p1  ORF type:complete len:358 (-),score=55.65 GHVT01069444.1:1544-2617(-)
METLGATADALRRRGVGRRQAEKARCLPIDTLACSVPSLLLLLLLYVQTAQAWIVPGSYPVDHNSGDPIALKVTSLSSVTTQLRFGYYELPYPQPTQLITSAENLGEILTGEKIQNSNFEIFMLTNERCKLLGEVDATPAAIAKFKSFIADNYVVNWIVENLPSTSRLTAPGGLKPGQAKEEDFYALGFPVGELTDGQRHVLNNHVHIRLKFHRSSQSNDKLRVVGFQVYPKSIKHKAVQRGPNSIYECVASTADDAAGDFSTASDVPPVVLEELGEPSEGNPVAKIAFTYDVSWEESPVAWASRWDVFVQNRNSKIHWFAILYSFLFLLVLSGYLIPIGVKENGKTSERKLNVLTL